jgi:hypothetical protein
MSDWIATPPASLQQSTAYAYGEWLRTAHSVRWMLASISLMWVGVATLSYGFGLALKSPTYPAFQDQQFVRAMHSGTDVNPTAKIFVDNTLDFLLTTFAYTFGGLIFTASIAFLAAVRNGDRTLSCIASVLFCGACLFLAFHWLEFTLECFRWHFAVYGLGLSAFVIALCTGGISALMACLPSRPGPGRQGKQLVIGW